MASQASRTSGAPDAVVDVVERIGDMLYSMQLLPGQSLRQEALASLLSVSRAPVREALRVLQSQGLVVHERNVGYAVRRLSRGELDQAYRMRELLEAEILGRLTTPDPAVVDRLNAANTEMADALKRGDFLAARRANHDFHFSLFNATGQQLVVEELMRIWALTEAYRSYYLGDPEGRSRIVVEHELIVSAYADGRAEDVVDLTARHRSNAATTVAPLLNP